jgi:hypothetical protein
MLPPFSDSESKPSTKAAEAGEGGGKFFQHAGLSKLDSVTSTVIATRTWNATLMQIISELISAPARH